MRKFSILTTAGVIATLIGNMAAQAQQYGYGMGGGNGSGYGGMMGGYGYGQGYGFGLIHMTIWAVILVAIIVGVVWLVRSLAAPHAHLMTPKRSAGLEVLEERYARGEVNREEYIQKKKDILG